VGGGVDAGRGKGGGDGGAEGDGGDGQDEVFTGHKIELLSADVDRLKATLRGDCDTQDALLAFQQAIERHRCFSKVKSSSDRISFERHRDWFRFNLRFEISCPEREPRKKKSKPRKGAKADAKEE
jgi:hypothetical protein